jgi:hypothetical protein
MTLFTGPRTATTAERRYLWPCSIHPDGFLTTVVWMGR